jgi:hypothetical protein
MIWLECHGTFHRKPIEVISSPVPTSKIEFWNKVGEFLMSGGRKELTIKHGLSRQSIEVLLVLKGVKPAQLNFLGNAVVIFIQFIVGSQRISFSHFDPKFQEHHNAYLFSWSSH